jgi:hypothetical protein
VELRLEPGPDPDLGPDLDRSLLATASANGMVTVATFTHW